MIAAGKEEIRKWFKAGVEQGHKYMLSVYDRMEDPEEADSAYYTDDEQEAWDMVGRFNADEMCKVMEVYDLTANFEKQLRVKRVWNLPE